MLTVALVLDDLIAGGAARVATTIAAALVAKGDVEAHLVLSDDGLTPPAFALPATVIRHHLAVRGNSANVLDGLRHNAGRVLVLRRELRKIAPDVVIAFLDSTNVLTLLASRGLAIPVIVSERTDPAGRDIGRAWEALRQLTYRWADALVCQGQRPLRYFPPHIRRRGKIIPNPVLLPADAEAPRASLERTGPERTLVALGSLRAEKGQDILLRAFATVAEHHPEWSLTIWGEGPMRAELQAQARSLGIDCRVRMAGSTREPFARLAEGDLFVLPSRVEGFPNALSEAMSVGLPVIAADVGAVTEIVRDGVNGVLVPPGSATALAAAMDRLMGDEGARRRLAASAPEVLERFSLEKVMAMWEALIAEVSASSAQRGPGRRTARRGVAHGFSRDQGAGALWRV